MEIQTPVSNETIANLKPGDTINISGVIYTGRDAVLPRLVKLIEDGKIQELGFNLQGGVIFHTAVSPAGVGPTTSNKVEIEGSIPALSAAGIKIHLGKGALSFQTVEVLQKYNSIFVITPPVTALLNDSILSKKVVAFAEEGMEAMHALEVKNLPGIVAIAGGSSIFK